MFEQTQLTKTLGGLGLGEDAEIFHQLKVTYTEHGRYYHDDSHITECLSQFQHYMKLAEHPHEIEIAIWFHDAIYDTHKPDNEEQSAAWAKRYLLGAGANRQSVNRIVKMILATKNHQVTSVDSKLMLDIDLGILGAPSAHFEKYDPAIRQEYHWVPEEHYRVGRTEVLRGFLDRDVIYHTGIIREKLEESARDNLTRKIAELSE